MAIKFKAVDDPTTPPAPPAAPTGPTTDEAIAMKKKIEDALAQLEKANEYDQYLTVGDKAELEKSKALLMADVEVIDYYLKTGEWIGATLPAGTTEAGNQYIDVTELDAGFYASNPATPTVAPVKLTPKADGKLYVDNNGGTSVLSFIMESSTDASKDMVNAVVESRGDDAVIRVDYRDGHSEEHVVAGGSVRSDIQIQIIGVNCDHEITVDATRFANVNPLTGERGGAVIIGTKFDDTLLGGAGRDTIMGAGGNDTIDGGSNVDDISGYASDEAIAGFGGEEVLGTDGDDKLYDMFGMNLTTSDNINGGTGTDTIYRGKTFGSAQAGQFTEGPPVELTATDPSEIANDDWFSGTVGWSYSADAAKGEVIVTKNAETANGGVVGMNIPEEYMASAVRDNNDLVFNVVKPGKNPGEQPEYYRVRIKDYYNSKGTKLDITGSFVDMGSTSLNELDVGVNPVALHGTGNDGDILIGPKTIFEQYAMSVEDLGVSTNTNSQLEAELAGYLDNPEVNKLFGSADLKSEPGYIVIDAANANANIVDGKLNIPANADSVAFVQYDNDKKCYIITIAGNDGLTSERTVLKVYTDQKLTVQLNSTGTNVYDLTSSTEYGVTINGGDGADFLAGYKYGTLFEDESGDVGIAMGIPSQAIDSHAGGINSEDAVTEGSVGEDIDAATTFDQLEGIQSTIDDMPDGDAKTNLQDKLNTKWAERLTNEIDVTLNGLLVVYDAEKGKDPDSDATTKAKEDVDDKIEEIKAWIATLNEKDPNGLGVVADGKLTTKLDGTDFDTTA